MGDAVALPEPVEHPGDFRLQRDRCLGQVVAASSEVFGEGGKVRPTVADRQDRLNYFSTLLDFYQNQKDEAGNKLLTLDKKEEQFVNAQISLIESDLGAALLERRPSTIKTAT